MTNATTNPQRGLVSLARWILAVLSLLFVAGALGQFFLVGLSMFDDGSRWQDHATLGHILGMLPWVLWIPAVVGKAGRGVIVATVLLLVLFEAQYAFINVDSSIANAFHPLNGSVLLVLGGWILQRAVGLIRQPSEATNVRPGSMDVIHGEAT